jgi:hypothetical protein
MGFMAARAIRGWPVVTQADGILHLGAGQAGVLEGRAEFDAFDGLDAEQGSTQAGLQAKVPLGE